MKKSLVIVSFAFIFLLSTSIVSAGFFDWITGDVKGIDRSGDTFATSVSKASNTEKMTTFSRTSEAKTAARKSRASYCPRGWDVTSAASGGSCCRKKETPSGALNRLLKRDNNDDSKIKVGDPCRSGGHVGTYAMGSSSMYCRTNVPLY